MKHPRLRVPVRATLILTGAGVVAKAVALLTTPLFTRALPPAAYGLYPLYNTWLGVFTVVGTLGVGAGVLYRGIQRDPANADAFLSGAVSFCALPTGLLLLATLLFPAFFSRLTGLPAPLLPLLCMQIGAETILTLAAARERYAYRPLLPAALLVGRAVLSPLFAWALLRLSERQAEARVFAAAGAALLFALPQAVALFRKAPPNAKNWRFLLRFQLPLLPHFASLSLMAETGRLLVGHFLGAEALAPFSLAVTVGLAPTLLTSGLLSVFQPWLLRKTAAGQTAEVGAVAGKILLALAGGAAGLILFLPEIFAFLAPAAYADGIREAVPIALTVLPMFLYPLFASVTLQRERTASASLASVAAALFSVAVQGLLIPRYGTMAAAWCMPFSYGVLTLLQGIFSRLSDRKNAIYVKSSLQIMLLSVLAALLFPRLYPYFLARFLLGSGIAFALCLWLWRTRLTLLERAPAP